HPDPSRPGPAYRRLQDGPVAARRQAHRPGWVRPARHGGRRPADVHSTNAEVPGVVTSEREIAPVLDEIFANTKQRIIVACFASHVHRVQQVLNAAVKHRRKVAFVGRSMVRNMGVARDLGYLRVPGGLLVDLREAEEMPPGGVVLISTGSQGEPMSALSRMA